MRYTGIYMISSIKKPERRYIGSAKNIYHRLAVHVCQLKKNRHCNKKLQRHFNKYGLMDLRFEPLHKVADKNDLIISEQAFINIMNPYFNANKVAGSNLGRRFGKMSESHKNKISLGNKGKKISEKTRELHHVKYFKYSLEGKLLKTYKSFTDANTIEKMRIRRSSSKNVTIGGCIWVRENDPLPDFEMLQQRLKDCKKVLNKKVLQIDKYGKLISVYDGVREAYRQTGIDHRSIAQVASGSETRKTAGGFIWQYKQGE